MYRKNAWKNYDDAEMSRLQAFGKEYSLFLDSAKTERECVTEARKAAEKAGFRNLDELLESGTPLQSGDRVYRDWMGKCFLAFIIGQEPLTKGMNILGAHIDCPHIDIKQNPLFENDGFAYLETHYYGGIKKFYWLALPLALHGVIVRKDGTKVIVNVGEDEDDPVFYFSDLLIHLSHDRMSQPADKIIEGDALDLMIGSQPLNGEEKDAVRANAMKLISDKYGVEEEDFVSAELEIVPAGKTRDVGFDRSMIAGFGHDDRVCSYPSLRALTDMTSVPAYTACAVLTDKEEVGSIGATGMQSRYFEDAVADLLELCGMNAPSALRRTLNNSRMLSSDVSAGYDPNFASAFEKKNAAFLGYGVCFNKYTGARGKSGSSDANAEYMAEIRRIMDDAGVAYQTAELGKVDVGGGGTIARYCAELGMNVIDAGVAVLSMHAPWELISKADLWEEYKAYCAFIAQAKPF